MTRELIGDLVGDGVDVAVRFGEPPPVVAHCPQAGRAAGHHCRGAELSEAPWPSARSKRSDASRLHRFARSADTAALRLGISQGRKVTAVKTKSRLLLSDAGTMLSECVAGTGIAQVFAVVAKDLLKSGKLVELSLEWADETFPLYAYYPSRHHPAAKVRAFVDFVLHAGVR